MSHLRDKSEINLEAAKLLQGKLLFPSVVHCAYYSCLQLMKHTALAKLGKTEVELSNQARSRNEGSHEVIINLITKHLRENNRDWRTFNNKIGQLKRLRVTADYANILIDYGISKDSLNLSEAVLETLKN